MAQLIILLVTLVYVTQVSCINNNSSCRAECNNAAICTSGFIIIDRDLPDESLTASSEVSSGKAKRARMDHYINQDLCVWKANTGAPEPHWIAVDLLECTTVTGVVIRKRCDPNGEEHLTGFKVQVEKSTGWVTIFEADDIEYRFGNNHFSFFAGAVCGRYWRIVVTDYNAAPSMKFDLIGCI